MKGLYITLASELSNSNAINVTQDYSVLITVYFIPNTTVKSKRSNDNIKAKGCNRIMDSWKYK